MIKVNPPENFLLNTSENTTGLGNKTVPIFENSPKSKLSVLTSAKKLSNELLKYYFNPTILCWSLWWALTTCGMFQV